MLTYVNTSQRHSFAKNDVYKYFQSPRPDSYPQSVYQFEVSASTLYTCNLEINELRYHWGMMFKIPKPQPL